MQTLSVVVPCYNEQAGLHQLFSQLRQLRKILGDSYALDVVFVDDGSTDMTFEMLSKFKNEFAPKPKSRRARLGPFARWRSGQGHVAVTICRHSVNKNLGAALKTGLATVKGDFVATVDADCTYPLTDVPKLLGLLDKETDIVIASPYHPAGKSDIRPAYRLFLSKAISKLYAFLTGAKIHTFTAIFRVYKRKVIGNVRPKSDGFLAVTEMLVFALRNGYKVKEVPATLTLRKYGKSKMKLFSTIMAHFLFCLRLLLRIEK